MSASGETGNTINIGELLENSRIGPLQIQVFILSMICLIMDGFDVQAMGYVAPAVVTDSACRAACWVPSSAAANFGVLIGSLVFSMRRRQDRPPPGAHRRHAVLLGHGDRHGVRAERGSTAVAALHRRHRDGLHHPERHGAGRRVQPEAEPRDVDDVHHRRLHRGRRDRRIRRSPG